MTAVTDPSYPFYFNFWHPDPIQKGLRGVRHVYERSITSHVDTYAINVLVDIPYDVCMYKQQAESLTYTQNNK